MHRELIQIPKPNVLEDNQRETDVFLYVPSIIPMTKWPRPKPYNGKTKRKITPEKTYKGYVMMDCWIYLVPIDPSKKFTNVNAAFHAAIYRLSWLFRWWNYVISWRNWDWHSNTIISFVLHPIMGPQCKRVGQIQKILIKHRNGPLKRKLKQEIPNRQGGRVPWLVSWSL